MLQFWKKTGKKEKTNATSPSATSKNAKKPSPPSLLNGNVHSLSGLHAGSVGPLSGFHHVELTGSAAGKYVANQRSQLSKTLTEVLHDKGALGYFIQYLEARGVLALIKFWLDVESFREAACHGTQSTFVPVTREELEITDDISKVSPQHSQLSLGTDCDSLFESPSHSIGSGTSNHSTNNTAKDPLSHSFPVSPNLVETKLGQCDNKSDLCSDQDRTENIASNSNILFQNSHAATFKLAQSDDSLKKGSELKSLKSHPTSLSVKSSISSRSRLSSNLLQGSMGDAIRIYRRYLSQGSVQRVPMDNDVKERVILAICKEDGIVDGQTFTEAQNIIFHIMEVEHYNTFLRSDFHCKHQIDVLTSGRVTMSDILYNETALFYFMEYLEQEGNRSLVEFWFAAVNFHQHLASKEGNYDSSEAQNDAMILYDKYFSMQATSPLGFSDRIRLDVEQNICREEGPLPDCFQGPINLVQLFLEKNYLASFLSSQLNMKYLTELVNTIQASPAMLSRHRKTGSESSSDWSISAQNTLLATEDATASSNKASKALRKVNGGDMCIDSRQLNDPDALWRRRRDNGLNFGRINHMGRFETDVEPEPDRKEESRIAKVVKKLVNMEEDKAKEEMAWQIAEMIVKDITSLTLAKTIES